MQLMIALIGIFLVGNFLFATFGGQVSLSNPDELGSGIVYLLSILIMAMIIVGIFMKIIFRGGGGDGSGHGGH